MKFISYNNMWSIEDLLNFIRILSHRKLENPRKYSLFYRSKNHYCWSCNLLSSSQFFRKLFSHQICLTIVISSPLFYGRRFFAGHAVFHRSLRHFPQFSFRLSFPLLPFSPCATTNIWLSIPPALIIFWKWWKFPFSTKFGDVYSRRVAYS